MSFSKRMRVRHDKAEEGRKEDGETGRESLFYISCDWTVRAKQVGDDKVQKL